jgi:hypothetical protein
MLQSGEGLLGGVQLGVKDLRTGAKVAVAGRDPSCHAVADTKRHPTAAGAAILQLGTVGVEQDGEVCPMVHETCIKKLYKIYTDGSV